MRSKDDPEIQKQARRVFDRCMAIEKKEIEAWESSGFTEEKTKRITDIQRRRAFAGRILNKGLLCQE